MCGGLAGRMANCPRRTENQPHGRRADDCERDCSDPAQGVPQLLSDTRPSMTRRNPVPLLRMLCGAGTVVFRVVLHKFRATVAAFRAALCRTGLNQFGLVRSRSAARPFEEGLPPLHTVIVGHPAELDCAVLVVDDVWSDPEMARVCNELVCQVVLQHADVDNHHFADVSGLAAAELDRPCLLVPPWCARWFSIPTRSC